MAVPELSQTRRTLGGCTAHEGRVDVLMAERIGYGIGFGHEDDPMASLRKRGRECTSARVEGDHEEDQLVFRCLRDVSAAYALLRD